MGKTNIDITQGTAAAYMWNVLVKPTVRLLFEQDPERVAEWLPELEKELGILPDTSWMGEDVLHMDRAKLKYFFKHTNIEVGGQHYQKAIQPWDYIAANGLGFDEGNVVKYITRHKDKNGAEDVKKAISYCQHILNTQYKEDKNGRD